jgi:hypothetical protein
MRLIMRVIYSVLIVILLSACQATQRYKHQTISVYNPEEISWSKLDGNSSVSGSAFIRQNGGGIVSCAGYVANLIPKSAYSNERISYLFGNLTRGYNTYRDIDTADSRYIADIRTTICDVDGKFKFTNLPDGVYYLTTTVSWNVANSAQGGRLFQKVDLKSGGNLEVVLTM